MVFRPLSLATTAALAAAAALPAAAQETAQTPVVGQGNEYRVAPPFPSQRDSQLWMRQITVIDPKTRQKATLNVLANSPVPNPGDVSAAPAAGRDASARVGEGQAVADAPPFPSQRDETFLVREITLIDPITGAAQRVRVLSNTPVPNPGNAPNPDEAGPEN